MGAVSNGAFVKRKQFHLWDVYMKVGPTFVGRIYLGTVSGKNRAEANAQAWWGWPLYRKIMILRQYKGTVYEKMEKNFEAKTQRKAEST